MFFEVGGKVFIERMRPIEIFHNEKIRNFLRKELLEEPLHVGKYFQHDERKKPY